MLLFDQSSGTTSARTADVIAFYSKLPKGPRPDSERAGGLRGRFFEGKNASGSVELSHQRPIVTTTSLCTPVEYGRQVADMYCFRSFLPFRLQSSVCQSSLPSSSSLALVTPSTTTVCHLLLRRSALLMLFVVHLKHHKNGHH